MDPALAKLTQYIEQQAQTEAEGILQQAQAEASRRLAAARQQQAECLQQQQDLLLRRFRLAAAEQQRQLEQQQLRQPAGLARQLADELFALAEQQLAALPAQSFQTFFLRSLRQLPAAGVYCLQLGQASADQLPESLPAQLLQSARQAGYHLQLTPETLPRQGGFLLQQPPVTYSFLFSDLLADLKKQLLPELLPLLLGGEALNA